MPSINLEVLLKDKRLGGVLPSRFDVFSLLDQKETVIVPPNLTTLFVL